MSHSSHAVFGPVSAVAPQPRAHPHGELTTDGQLPAPWRSRRLPRALSARDRRRTTFRTLLRHSEGVPVELSDGAAGIVEEVVLPVLGFDFWAEELIVATSDGRRLRVPVGHIDRIDVQAPRIVVGQRTTPR